jgi:hypothetical protein
VTVFVNPAIPAQCLAPIESWLFRRIFTTEAIGDRLGFHANWTLNDLYEGEVFSDEELLAALAGSRQICPDLCSAVEREVEKSGVIIIGAADYESIFQAILRRHTAVLGHISIEENDRNTKSFYGNDTFTLITADAIESIRTQGEYEQNLLKKVKLVHQSGPHNAASPYIRFSRKDV